MAPAASLVVRNMKLLSDSKLSKTDRLVLLVVLTYWVSGSFLESMRRHSDGSTSILLWTGIAGFALILSVLVALLYGSRRGSISLGHWGFSHGWGMWLNLGLVALATVLVIGQLPPTRFSLPESSYWKILGAFTEEVVFRVYLIRVVSILLSPRRGNVSWAVFLCAAAFTAMHLFRGLPAATLLGLFTSSLIVGYITYYTRSMLFAAYLHVLSNTGPEIGLFGGGIAIAAYLVISLYSSWRANHSMNLLRCERR